MKRVLAAVFDAAIMVLPESLIRALLPRHTKYSVSEVVPLPAPVATATRLYIAPVNWAGQAWQWARAAERHVPGVSAVTMAYRVGGEFGFPVDQSVPVGAYVASRSWQRAQHASVIGGFSHVLIEAERQPLGRTFGQSVQQQARELTAAGLSVAMVCHGSDIRLPSRHAGTEADSPFAPGLWSGTVELERQAVANRAILDELGLSVFVSTPDLLLDVPYAEWLPVIVEPAQWAATAALQRAIPVVAHAPSKGIIKGSDLIDPIMRKLDAEGVISYLRVEGVPAAEMPAMLASADVLLDQFRIGSYGVSACEALAAGRLSIGHVSSQVREHVFAVTGRELPIIEATAATVEEVVRSISAEPGQFRDIAARGPEFVQDVHDGTRSARVLSSFLSENAQ